MSYHQACMGTTIRNKRCKNIAGEDGYCYIHRNIDNSSNKEEVLIMEEKRSTPTVPTADIPARRLKVCFCNAAR